MMSLFDRYIAVDWSAANTPVRGRDSIWIGEAIVEDGDIRLLDSRNPHTRAAAIADIEAILLTARRAGERVIIGFDFVFGYPSGAAEAMTGRPGWQSLWRRLDELVVDDDDNRSNRFEVAATLNAGFADAGHHYWGHPQGRTYQDLAPTRPRNSYRHIAEHRIAERMTRGPQPVWKLTGAGAVGSQSMLGIARLEKLRRHPTLGPDIAVWPFETEFERNLSRPVTLVEIYPSLLPPRPGIEPRDRAQVEACVLHYAGLDRAGRLGAFLSSPPALTPAQRDIALTEEGWIAGVGVDAGLPAEPITDPAAIYAESFAIIRREADLSHLARSLHPVAIRMIHACGMVDLAADIAGTPDLPKAVARALTAGAPVFCDAEMVRAGLIRRYLPPAAEILVTLDQASAGAATDAGTTRSALAVDSWLPRLAGAVIVIGNAPTALFRLLDHLEAGAPRPAAIIGAPVGFVGAAESKQRLATANHGIPFVTVLGRRGGSSIAAAAFNAVFAREAA